MILRTLMLNKKCLWAPGPHDCWENVEKTLTLSSWRSPNHRPFSTIYRKVCYLINESVSFRRGVDGESCLTLMFL